jgi:hypothetical protein
MGITDCIALASSISNVPTLCHSERNAEESAFVAVVQSFEREARLPAWQMPACMANAKNRQPPPAWVPWGNMVAGSLSNRFLRLE